MQPPEKLCSTESEKIAREFVDNWSHFRSLLDTQSELDVLKLLELLENVRANWQKSEAEASHYKGKLTAAEKNVKELKAANEQLNVQLLNCQAQLGHVSECKRAIEDELDEYKEQWEKLRQILKDNEQELISGNLLALLNHNVQRSGSVRRNAPHDVAANRLPSLDEDSGEVSTMESSHSEIDYDRTNESLEASFARPNRGSLKRRSRSVAPEASRNATRFAHSTIQEEPEFHSAPSKRSRNEHDTEITATFRIDPSGNRDPTANVTIRRSLNRSRSESTLIEVKEKVVRKPLTPHFTPGRSNIKSPHNGASWTCGQEIERRIHRVENFKSLFEACDVCAKGFGIRAQNALKCVDCNIRFHRHCQSRAPMPCVPKVPIPKTPSKQKRSLIQYCPETHPFIPPLMIYCVVALERDRLTDEGIYRLPGIDNTVVKLYSELLSERKVPNLTNCETENITACIVKFLRELRDSLIPSTSYDDFIRAVAADDEQALVQAVFELSAPNRDTLAYFILHLQKVAKHSSHNKMPIENLARVLAPTVVGYSKLVTPCVENVQELIRNQYMILLRLLKIPTEFWRRFIENNMSAVLAAESRTPGSKTALLTVTPTKSSSRRTRFSNNNTTIVELHPEVIKPQQQQSANSSPLIQPLSMASKGMRGISFKPAF